MSRGLGDVYKRQVKLVTVLELWLLSSTKSASLFPCCCESLLNCHFLYLLLSFLSFATIWYSLAYLKLCCFSGGQALFSVTGEPVHLLHHLLHHHLHCPVLNCCLVTIGQRKVWPGCKKDRNPDTRGDSSQSVFFTWPWQFVSFDFITSDLCAEIKFIGS